MINRIVLAVLAVLLVVGGYLLYQRIEPYEETIDTGWSPAALRNPYFAAQRFLERSGRTVNSGIELDQLQQMPDGGTIVVEDASQIVSETRVEALLAWVERGGVLVVGASHSDDQDQGWLFEHFAVSRRATGYERNCGCTKGAVDDEKPKKLSELLREANEEIKKGIKPKLDKEKSQRERTYPDAELAHLHFGDTKEAVVVRFDPDYALDQPHAKAEPDQDADVMEPLYWNGSSVGAQLLQFEYGDGLITVLSDIAIWNSTEIGAYDHAHLLDILAAPRQPVYLLYGAQMPGLGTLLWRHSSELLIAAGVWLGAWLFYRARRFGPVRAQPQPIRRSLAEHIQAAAAYLWHSGADQQLLHSARAAVQRRAQQLLPGYAALPPARQFELLSTHTGIGRDRIERALSAAPGGDAEAFREIVITLQNIGKKL